MKLKKIYYSLLLGILMPFRSASALTTGGGLQNPIKINSIPELITAIIDIIIAVGTPIAVLFLIYAGFKFVLARGNESELTKAKEMLVWTIIGIVILLGAKVLSVVIEGTITQLTEGL